MNKWITSCRKTEVKKQNSTWKLHGKEKKDKNEQEKSATTIAATKTIGCRQPELRLVTSVSRSPKLRAEEDWTVLREIQPSSCQKPLSAYSPASDLPESLAKACCETRGHRCWNCHGSHEPLKRRWQHAPKVQGTAHHGQTYLPFDRS